MRSSLFNIWFGGEEEQLGRIFKDFLRTPGAHPGLTAWYQVAQGEPLALLYEVWEEANKIPEQTYQYVEMFMERYNVLVGEDMAGTAVGVELFYSDLTELCAAVDMWLSTGQLTSNLSALAAKSGDYYRSIGGMNPGAVNVIRGWYEMLQVIQDRKRLIRCVAPDCNKLLIITPDSELLSGTVDGYHNTDCRVAHIGNPDDEVQLQELPGMSQLQEAVGPIAGGGPDGEVDPPETS